MSTGDTTAPVTVVTYAEACAALGNDRLEVGGPGAEGAFGSIRWLRAASTRFSNGKVHDRRRAAVVRELEHLEPDGLRDDAFLRSCLALGRAQGSGATTCDVMSLLARRVPMQSLAAALGFARVEEAGECAIALSAGYFPGSAPRVEELADRAVARLIELAPDVAGPRLTVLLTLLAQACDATAGVIGAALIAHASQVAHGRTWTTDQLLAEVVRLDPPNHQIRRSAAALIDGYGLAPGDLLQCDVVRVNRDPAAFARPDEFDPIANQSPTLTFGAGIRPCPGREHALALAAGVVEAATTRATVIDVERVAYEPTSALRIAQRIEVTLDQ